ncbi:PAS domain S-box protein [Salipaludibacillus neizhouensis]|nr:PAS domain S-box protein [Salipaludibacillus neizhouensis]
MDILKALTENEFYLQKEDAILLFDLTGIIINGNRSAEELTGFSVGELCQSRLNSLVIEEKDSNILHYLLIRAEDGFTENTEMAIRNKSGERIDLAIEIAPLFVNDNVIGMYGTLKR